MNLEKIIWLREGCPFDETDGHTDDLWVFASPGVILLTWADDQNDSQYEVSNERIAATNINYYIGNNAVFVPLYEDPNDKVAMATIQQVFPTRKVTGVPGCRDILLGGGSIGCNTQPQYSGEKIDLSEITS